MCSMNIHRIKMLNINYVNLRCKYDHTTEVRGHNSDLIVRGGTLSSQAPDTHMHPPMKSVYRTKETTEYERLLNISSAVPRLGKQEVLDILEDTLDTINYSDLGPKGHKDTVWTSALDGSDDGDEEYSGMFQYNVF